MGYKYHVPILHEGTKRMKANSRKISFQLKTFTSP